MEKKRSNIVKKFRICIIGPSYVGKTQIVNRLVSNSFSGFYEPTISPNVFRIGYNLNENNKDLDPKYFDIELIDLFPLDHPLLNNN
jgi:GTPase SAR1 family protein